MNRFYLLFGTTVALVASAWTVSGLAQDAGPRPPIGLFGAAPPPAPPGGAMLPPLPPPFPPPGPMAGVEFDDIDDFGPPPPPPPPPGMPGHGPRPGRQPADMCLDRMAAKAALVAYTKARLNLTSEQLGAWQEVETVLGGARQDERAACAKPLPNPEQVDALQRNEGLRTRLASQLDRLNKLDGPMHKLVALLSPEQRQVLDRLPPLPF
ncbi:LTXXQ motif family protein [Enhydrobacter aerosaccus]|uniref:LTXXQ motif family protein n=1 Tax=Enhydrobacter aerosaccus TaxID=225324 RepID=A0A1T4SPT8_9HYPH|nr:Spy/CpxP family protein refolding chaperone [Enhydrobacter aerosaccus]SKA30197.1 LTXXQ motif family protein [Enhydrobacter aerosaccus]